VRFRHSRGAVADTGLVHSTRVEVIWTIASSADSHQSWPCRPRECWCRPRIRRATQLTIRVTGYQWKWGYEYVDSGVTVLSTLDRASNAARALQSGIDPNTVPNYLLSVDHPLVVPAGVKVRLLITAQDVIHSWWMPALGIKKDAIPGFINEAWFKIDDDKRGLYRGQCAELCGRDHGFMPIVIDVRSKSDFDQWVKSQQPASSTPATTPATPATAAAPPTAAISPGAAQQRG
jgi:cytochrome c oxidase subunit 2